MPPDDVLAMCFCFSPPSTFYNTYSWGNESSKEQRKLHASLSRLHTSNSQGYHRECTTKFAFI